MKKKVLSVLITVLIIILILIGLLGAVAANYNYKELLGKSKEKVLGNIEYTASPISSSDNVLPGWTAKGTTSVYFVSSSDLDAYYYCTIKLLNEEINSHIYLKVNDNDLKLLSKEETQIVKGQLKKEKVSKGKTGEKHSSEYELIYGDTSLNKNEPFSLKAQVSCYVEKEDNSIAKDIIDKTVYYKINDIELNKEYFIGESVITSYSESVDNLQLNDNDIYIKSRIDDYNILLSSEICIKGTDVCLNSDSFKNTESIKEKIGSSKCQLTEESLKCNIDNITININNKDSNYLTVSKMENFCYLNKAGTMYCDNVML